MDGEGKDKIIDHGSAIHNLHKHGKIACFLQKVGFLERCSCNKWNIRFSFNETSRSY